MFVYIIHLLVLVNTFTEASQVAKRFGWFVQLLYTPNRDSKEAKNILE
jgi:hypothetical protein